MGEEWGAAFQLCDIVLMFSFRPGLPDPFWLWSICHSLGRLVIVIDGGSFWD
jgi:hypothetical protein